MNKLRSILVERRNEAVIAIALVALAACIALGVLASPQMANAVGAAGCWLLAAVAAIAFVRARRKAEPKPIDRKPVEWNPLAVLFGVVLGSWFGSH